MTTLEWLVIACLGLQALTLLSLWSVVRKVNLAWFETAYLRGAIGFQNLLNRMDAERQRNLRGGR